jgi:hypothetical protein
MVDMLVHVDVRPPDRNLRNESGGQPAAPRPLVRVIERIWRAATDRVAKSFWPLS